MWKQPSSNDSAILNFMKVKTTGRIAVSTPLSLQPEEVKFVERRVKDLGRKVGSRSNYVQQLIALDRQFDLIENSALLYRLLKPKR
jgi:hypothetical protein